jgi:hypothetical protein
MSLFDRLLGRSASKPAPVPAGPICDALVVYALSGPQADPDADAPRFVSLRFDPQDARLILDAPDAPAFKRGTIQQLRTRLSHAQGLRDPNSRGRLRHLTDWLADHEPAHLAWRLEPEADAAS